MAAALVLLGTATLAILATGCDDHQNVVREIQVQRQSQMQSESQQDHLAEAFRLLQRLVTLNPEKARRQITYHLNRWSDQQGDQPNAVPPEILGTLGDVVSIETAREDVLRTNFVPSDVNHLRDAYLFRQIVRWVDTEPHDDPVLTEWFSQLRGELGDRPTDTLRTASRLFDWTVRNVTLEPLQLPPLDQRIEPPSLPSGMEFRGPGYRQSDYMSVWRGLGDAWQRAGVFTQLCRQAGVPAAVLATQSTDSGELTPWSVGVLAGEEIYLFEPGLGTFIPGPGQVGIATLRQARQQELVMRRLNVPGFFDYPLDQQDVQQSFALVNAMPEGLSGRMKRLEQGLTGDRRMNLFVDTETVSKRFVAASGIAGVRLWKVPLMAIIYQSEMETAAERDPIFEFWYRSRWAILEADTKGSRELALGRWRHLHGDFADDETENRDGARTLYLAQRAPEFEIADLRIDVELQKEYGIRRQLGVDPEIYDAQVRRIQELMRLGKRTATYWLSLLQYDDGRYDTAENWFKKRVLDHEPRSIWESAARYNLARALEQLGKIDRAVELYKTVDDTQEHGNRIRARLITQEAR